MNRPAEIAGVQFPRGTAHGYLQIEMTAQAVDDSRPVGAERVGGAVEHGVDLVAGPHRVAQVREVVADEQPAVVAEVEAEAHLRLGQQRERLAHRASGVRRHPFCSLVECGSLLQPSRK